MHFERGGHVPGGDWIVTLRGKTTVFQSTGAGFPRLDRLYVPKVEEPSDYRDYSNKLIVGAREQLLSVLASGSGDGKTVPTVDRNEAAPAHATEATIIPPIDGASEYLGRIKSSRGLPERNMEDLVKELLVRLGHSPASVVFQIGHIDVLVRGGDGKPRFVIEVKTTLTSYVNDVFLYTAAGAAVTAKSSGNVGIGTVTPVNRLSVAGSADVTGNLGVGTTAPAAKLDVRGNVRLGSTGQYSALGAQEDLRLVRGDIDGNGTIIRGTGFTVVRVSEGVYDVMFSPAFSGIPTVMATAVIGTGEPRWATNAPPFQSASTARIVMVRSGTGFTDSDWSLCVIGPR